MKKIGLHSPIVLLLALAVFAAWVDHTGIRAEKNGKDRL